MIYIYSIIEKVLKETTVRLADGQQVHIVTSQRYISWIGPWFPASVKMSQVFNAEGQEISRKNYDAEIKALINQEKKSIPFQIGFFRNTIAFAVIISALLIIMPQINQRKAAAKELSATALNERIETIKVGDIYRINFFNDAQGESFKAIGVIKITAVDGDKISFSRGLNTIEDTFKNRDVSVDDSAFSTEEESFSKKTLINTGQDHSVISMPTEQHSVGYIIGKIITSQN